MSVWLIIVLLGIVVAIVAFMLIRPSGARQGGGDAWVAGGDSGGAVDGTAAWTPSDTIADVPSAFSSGGGDFGGGFSGGGGDFGGGGASGSW